MISVFSDNKWAYSRYHDFRGVELRIKLTCCNDNFNRPSMKSWSDKGVETSESVEGDQEMSGRLNSPKTTKISLSER